VRSHSKEEDVTSNSRIPLPAQLATPHNQTVRIFPLFQQTNFTIFFIDLYLKKKKEMNAANDIDVVPSSLSQKNNNNNLKYNSIISFD
jgi:hypothetical protein